MVPNWWRFPMIGSARGPGGSLRLDFLWFFLRFRRRRRRSRERRRVRVGKREVSGHWRVSAIDAGSGSELRQDKENELSFLVFIVGG